MEGYKVLVCGDINSLPCPVQTAGCDFASIRIIAALSLPVISSRALIALRARRAIIHRLAPPLSANTPVNRLVEKERRSSAVFWNLWSLEVSQFQLLRLYFEILSDTFAISKRNNETLGNFTYFRCNHKYYSTIIVYRTCQRGTRGIDHACIIV